jgi:hypothetical protein
VKKLFVLLILLASVAGAQIVPPGASNLPVQSGMSMPGCNAYSLVFIDSSGNLKCNLTPVNGSVSTSGRGIFTVADAISGSSATSNFLNLTSSFNGTLSAATSAVLVSTTVDNDAQLQAGVKSTMAGTAGTLTAAALWGENGATGSVGVGVYGISTAAATARLGGFFGLGAVVPTTSSALGADNGAIAANIAEFRDNGAVRLVVQDGGSQYVTMGSKSLLGGGAVNFVQVGVASGGYQGGVIEYCADASDGTEFQSRCGILPIALINKGGTETCTVGTPGTSSESIAVSAGTFTVAFTTDTSPTNACNFAANGTSSLTENVMRINFTVRLFGNVTSAATAQ